MSPPVHRASTVVFPTFAAFERATSTPYDGFTYGRYGIPASAALESLTAGQRDALARQWLENQTNAEDVSLTEAVQRGLRSRGHRQGHFNVDDTHASERSVHRFRRRVADALGL